MIFTDLDAALEEAQFIADDIRGCGQRRSAFIVQKSDVWGVSGRRPRGYIAMEVKPSTKRVRGYYFNPNRKGDKPWAASHYITKGKYKFLGWFKYQKEAVAAVKQYKDSLNER